MNADIRTLGLLCFQFVLPLCCGCESETIEIPKPTPVIVNPVVPPNALGNVSGNQANSDTATERKPGDDTKEFISAFGKAKDGCFAKDLKLSKDCWKTTLVQKVFHMTGHWPIHAENGTSLFRVYPDIDRSNETGLFTCIYLKVDDETISVNDFRDAFTKADSKLRILEHVIATPDKDKNQGKTK